MKAILMKTVLLFLFSFLSRPHIYDLTFFDIRKFAFRLNPVDRKLLSKKFNKQYH